MLSLRRPDTEARIELMPLIDVIFLILTFFILLVSLSHEQSFGLLADGVGSFRVALSAQPGP